MAGLDVPGFILSHSKWGKNASYACYKMYLWLLGRLLSPVPGIRTELRYVGYDWL